MHQSNLESNRELEWMLQDVQVSDEALAGALAQHYFTGLYHVARLAVRDPSACHHAVQAALQAAVANRHRYTGQYRLRAWLYRQAFRLARRTQWRGWIRRRLAGGAEKHRALLAAENGEDIPGTFGALDGFRQAALLLRYRHGLTARETGYVVGQRPHKLHAFYQALRQAEAQKTARDPYAAQNDLLDGPAYLHEDARELACADLDGLLPDHSLEQARLGEHLMGCGSCRLYAEQQAELDRQIQRQVEAAWSLPEMQPAAVENLAGELNRRAVHEGQTLRRVRWLKEVVFSLLVVAVIGGMAWWGGQEGPENPLPVTQVAAARTPASANRVAPATQLPLSSRSDPAGRQFPAPTAAPRRAAPTARPPQATIPTALDMRLDFSAAADSASLEPLYSKPSHSGSINLAAMLRYWGWGGSQSRAVLELQPNANDENVMPYELLAFVDANTSLRAIQRLAGEGDLLRQFVQAGFPVLVERGLETETGWLGVYEIVSGFDAAANSLHLTTFITGQEHSSSMALGVFVQNWRAFNYSYLVIYPAEKEALVMNILGDHANQTENYRLAAGRASSEIYSSTGLDLFFAWFNRGTSLSYLDDYNGAAKAFDEAFNVYADLPKVQRPWRILWYQTRPYWAYYYTGRYSDLLNLATSTLETMEEPLLEESYYWRALAREALGDIDGAIGDLKQSLQLNPNFVAGLYQLRRLNGGS